jgi:hypothetical protein
MEEALETKRVGCPASQDRIPRWQMVAELIGRGRRHRGVAAGLKSGVQELITIDRDHPAAVDQRLEVLRVTKRDGTESSIHIAPNQSVVIEQQRVQIDDRRRVELAFEECIDPRFAGRAATEENGRRRAQNGNLARTTKRLSGSGRDPPQPDIQKRKEPLKVYLKGLKVGDDLLSRSAVSSAASA